MSSTFSTKFDTKCLNPLQLVSNQNITTPLISTTTWQLTNINVTLTARKEVEVVIETSRIDSFEEARKQIYTVQQTATTTTGTVSDWVTCMQLRTNQFFQHHFGTETWWLLSLPCMTWHSTHHLTSPITPTPLTSPHRSHQHHSLHITKLPNRTMYVKNRMVLTACSWGQ